MTARQRYDNLRMNMEQQLLVITRSELHDKLEKLASEHLKNFIQMWYAKYPGPDPVADMSQDDIISATDLVDRTIRQYPMLDNVKQIIPGSTALLEADRAAVWTLEDAVELCRIIEGICPAFGCHVALTGGCLYKAGRRKDADIMFYRIRQVNVIDQAGLLEALSTGTGIEIKKKHGWVVKAEYDGKPIDFFFPEDITEDKDNNCMDGQYPDGPDCPSCHKRRKKVENTWVHYTDEDECGQIYINDVAVGILQRNPATGDRVCEFCKRDLNYDPYHDHWSHNPIMQLKEPGAASVAVCKMCNNLFSSVSGAVICGTCIIQYAKTIKRDMNPNFIGLQAPKNAAGTVGIPTPPPTNQKPIIQPAEIDISDRSGVRSERH